MSVVIRYSDSEDTVRSTGDRPGIIVAPIQISRDEGTQVAVVSGTRSPDVLSSESADHLLSVEEVFEGCADLETVTACYSLISQVIVGSLAPQLLARGQRLTTVSEELTRIGRLASEAEERLGA